MNKDMPCSPKGRGGVTPVDASVVPTTCRFGEGLFFDFLFISNLP